MTNSMGSVTVHASRPFDVDAYCRDAAAIRRRLMRPHNAVVAPPVLVAPQAVHRVACRPLWQRVPIKFDSHVFVWQRHLINAKISPCEDYIRRRCAEIGADYDEIMGATRRRAVTGKRQLLMFEVVKRFGLTWAAAGRLFRRDHSVIIHAVNRIASILGEEIPAPTNEVMRLVGNVDLKNMVKRDYEITRLPIEEIAKRYSISRDTVKTVAKMENWYRPDSTVFFIKVRIDTKICMADVQRDYEDGMSCNRIGIRHGISDRTVKRLADRHGWERKVQS